MRISLILLISFLFLFPNIASSQELSCQLTRKDVEVGLDPARDKVTVYGQAPKDAPIVIKIEGPERPVLVSLYQDNSLMKFSEAEVLGLPGYYQVLTSVPAEEIADRYWMDLGITPDYKNLKNEAWVRMRQYIEEVYQRNQQDYIKLATQIKEQKHLYSIRQAVVKRNGENYTAEIPLLEGMPLGQIKITAMTVAKGKIISSDTQILNLKPSSFLSIGSQELSISAVMVISLFMVPIILLTTAQILEAIQQRREQKRRERLLRQICRDNLKTS